MFCPECRAEYLDGVTECSDCHVNLVATRVQTDQPSKRIWTGINPDTLANAIVGTINQGTISWYFETLGKYAVFSGRARRREYLLFEACNAVVVFALFVIDISIGTMKPGGLLLLTLSGLYALGVAVPSLAGLVRRLHDTGRSGWWLLSALIPLFGAISLLIFILEDSQPGDNRFGPNPKEIPANPVDVQQSATPNCSDHPVIDFLKPFSFGVFLAVVIAVVIFVLRGLRH